MGLTELAVGGIAPRRHVRPRDADELAAVVRAADEAGQAIVPLGGRTRIEVGNAPARYDVALDLGGLAGLVEHEPADLTATVRAGTTIASLREHLARHGQHWPVEVGRPAQATVGGTLAGAAAGPSRLRYGHPRDWVVGARAVLGDGTLARAGGKVVKNVTGYDLARFYAGSYGSLAVLAEVSLKLWPLPHAERTLVSRFRGDQEARDALGRLRADGVTIDAAVLLDRAAGTYLGHDATLVAVRLRGSPKAVARLADAAARALGPADDAPGTLWDEIADVPHRARVALRLTAPESRIGPLLRVAQPGLVAYPGTGIAFIVREDAEAKWIATLRAAAEAAEGSCVVERAPRSVRGGLDAWGAPAMPLELARRVKAAFDPRSTLSPGRMAGGI